MKTPINWFRGFCRSSIKEQVHFGMRARRFAGQFDDCGPLIISAIADDLAAPGHHDDPLCGHDLRNAEGDRPYVIIPITFQSAFRSAVTLHSLPDGIRVH